MQILKIISLLMNYPSAELQAGRDELNAAIAAAKEIPPSSRQQLAALVNRLCDSDLMDAQEIYTSLFDRGRSLSLLLFEHVHGESRDRGQAMVDLMAQYQQAGFEIDVQELPDYIPMYLEYLSTRDDLDARVGLADVSEILAIVSARLQERDSDYHCLFDALLTISGVPVTKAEMSELLETAKSEDRDDTPEAIDKLWEEEAVTFSNPADGGASCGLNKPVDIPKDVEVPVQWLDASRHCEECSDAAIQ
ncbi:nitrate reductase molybdenum cofactor assembly chaperone [Porticoccus sp. W117]|uniref:nitrate reductase molybdenum cofactor assembly chaperone n=1 Tax=Porticoccus sp. W117 TaxID=3054777 RepID=UPI00259ADB7A|nr:nitrate reductase molybdenum cofactor assembly chaperone [Porticoccus sp. W117]MDM3870374.1 nitrate reductase molybdenum cofactor assembly chaperone [Porticoccus sp. W117]